MTTSLVESADPECAAPGVVNELAVNSSSDAAALKTLLDSCDGGMFDVSWHGRVAVDDTFYVGFGTSLNITGVAGSSSSSQPSSDGSYADDPTRAAAIEGSPSNALLNVYQEGTLALDNLDLAAYDMTHKFRSVGGAIYAYTYTNETSESVAPPSPATVNIIDCTFRNYTVDFEGKLEYF